MNEAMFTATIVEPTGVPARIEIKMPTVAQITESTAAHTVTARKLLKMRIAQTAGNTTSAEIKSVPTRFIASTITVATTIARIKLYSRAFMPVATAKSSSKVTEKILL